MAVLQIHRRVEASAGGVIIHDFQVFAHWPVVDVLPGHVEHDLIDARRLQCSGQARTQGIPQQPTERGRADGRLQFLKAILHKLALRFASQQLSETDENVFEHPARDEKSHGFKVNTNHDRRNFQKMWEKFRAPSMVLVGYDSWKK